MKKSFALLSLVMIALLAACNMPVGPTPTTEGISSTLAVQTLQAMMTQVVDKATQSTSYTATPRPATATVPAATSGPGASSTPVKPASTATSAPPPCDAVSFVSDVTIPDGTVFTAGTKFTKTWRLRNAGVCTWTTNYAVVFIDGNAMGASAAINLPATVPPGQTIDLSIDMTAPSNNGTYQGNWKLRNPAGLVFGTGGADSSFYVQIKVQSPASTSGGYLFADNVCSAEWSNGSKTLKCPMKDGDALGYAFKVNNAVLETGTQDNDAGLIMAPENVNNGILRAKFPPLTVQNYDHFLTIVQCAYQASSCNVRFQLDYQIDNNSIQTLGSWDQTYDNSYKVVDVDLSSLAGKNVNIILTIMANGSASGDRALWLLPRIENHGPTPTPK